ncbi:unnamed protein product, partial [Ectocarpus sp. 4 AP-2014]
SRCRTSKRESESLSLPKLLAAGPATSSANDGQSFVPGAGYKQSLVYSRCVASRLMLSLRFLAVRNVPHAPANDECCCTRKATWSIHTQGGRSTSFVDLDTCSQQQQQEEEASSNKQQTQEKRPAPEDDLERVTTAGMDFPAATSAPTTTAATITTPVSTAVTAPMPLWPEEVEVEDREGQDTVQIALVFELAPTTTAQRESFCHSVGAIDVRDFRSRPDETVTLWKPLRPVEASPHKDSLDSNQDVGAVQIAITYYSDDCVDHGYTFAAFCGLIPLPLILFLANTKRSSLLPAGKFLPKSRSDGDGRGSTVLERYSSTASTASLSSTASARSSKDHGSHEGDKKDSATTSRATKKDKLKPGAAATARSLPVRVEIL